MLMGVTPCSADLKESGELPKRIQVRTSKLLNNAIEQEHRRIKAAAAPSAGIEELANLEQGEPGGDLASCHGYVTGLVRRPVQIPFASQFHLCFVHARGATDGSGEPVPALLEFGGALLDHRRIRCVAIGKCRVHPSWATRPP